MSDEEFLKQFETQTLPRGAWTHRAHLRVAYLYLTQSSYEEALVLMRNGVQSYNAAKGIETTPTMGYHETVTQVWLRLVQGALQESDPEDSAEAFIDKHTELEEKQVLFRYYSLGQLMSEEARKRFVEPDLLPLPG